MKRILLTIFGILIAILILWQLYLYFYMKQFDIMDTNLGQLTVKEWKQAPEEEKISACAIGLSGLLKSDGILNDNIKKIIKNPESYKRYSTLCANYTDEYIQLVNAPDDFQVALATSMAIGFKGWLVVQPPDEINPFLK